MGASGRGIRGHVSWIGDTSNWLDRAEGARDRYDRELKAKAAQEEQRQRALQQDEARKLTLDDDGFQVLANAVLLAWFAPDPRADIDLQRIVFSERAELRDLLVSQGADAEEWADLDGASLVEARDRLYRLRRGSAAFALVRPKDLHPLDGARLPELVGFALLGAKPSELRTPIGLLGRCPLTLSLRRVVLDYFRGEQLEAPDTAEGTAVQGGPRTRQEVAREDQAKACLREVANRNPERRATKRVWLDAAQERGFSGKAAERIWDAAAPDGWRLSGRPSRDSSLFSVSELIAILPPA